MKDRIYGDNPRQRSDLEVSKGRKSIRMLIYCLDSGDFQIVRYGPGARAESPDRHKLE